VRCVLDLGLQKTGSKARQQFFAAELHRVLGMHATYPNAGRQGIWHYPLYDALQRGDRSQLALVLEEVRHATVEPGLLILSYEELYKLGEEQVGWLGDSLPNLTCLVFLRRQDQLVSSFHNQMHKAHTVTLQELESFEARMLEYDLAWDHRATLERWTTVLGRRAVVPILFEKTFSSVVAFFHHARLAVDWTGYRETYPNQAVDPFGLAVLRWVKRLLRDERKLWSVMTETHRRLGAHFVAANGKTERYSLTLAERGRVMSAYEASNEWVRREFFPERRTLFSPLEPGECLRTDQAAGRELAEEILAAVENEAGRSPDR
jgi:hypothetical protein